MSNPFKVGDIVIALKSSGGLASIRDYRKGSRYRVTSLTDNVIQTEALDGGHTNGWYYGNFGLVVRDGVMNIKDYDGKGPPPEYIYKIGTSGTFVVFNTEQVSSEDNKERIWYWGITGQHEILSNYKLVYKPSEKNDKIFKLYRNNLHTDEEKTEPKSKPFAGYQGLQTMGHDFYVLMMNEDKYWD